MITLYSGTPGSGKSLHLASRLYWKVKSNQPIICNFPIAVEKITTQERDCFTYVDNSQLTPKFLIEYAENYWKSKGGKVKEDTILLVIDECQMMFNSRDWGRKDRKEWLEFFTIHRHLGYEILLCCQFDRMLDRQIRCLIEYEYVHRKMKNFGWKGWIFNFCCGGRLHVCVKKWYPLKEKIGSEFFKAKKKYYQIYDTFMMFNDAQCDKPSASSESGTAKQRASLSDLTDWLNEMEANKQNEVG